MAARSLPDSPTFVTASEREVWQRAQRQLPDDCIIVSSVRIADRHKDHEADLVLLMPDSGIVVVEVKGSHVWVDNGQWFIQRREGPDRIYPVDQARDAQYALRTMSSPTPAGAVEAACVGGTTSSSPAPNSIRNSRPPTCPAGA